MSLDVSTYDRIGMLLSHLHAAKAWGWDWYISSSWCSDHPLVVIVVRKPATRVMAGQPVLGLAEGRELEEALTKAVGIVEGGR